MPDKQPESEFDVDFSNPYLSLSSGVHFDGTGMSEESNDRIVRYLMEELLQGLASREDIKRALKDLAGLPTDEVIQRLLDEFAAVANKHALESGVRHEMRTQRPPPGSAAAPIPEKAASPPLRDLPVESPSLAVPPPSVPAQEPIPRQPAASPPGEPSPAGVPPRQSPVKAKQEKSDSTEKLPPASTDDDAPKGVSRHEEIVSGALKDLDRLSERWLSKPLEGENADSGRELDMTAGKGSRKADSDDEVDGGSGFVVEGIHPQRSSYEFGEDDVVYVHGVSLVDASEGDTPEAFLLEEKGIDPRSFIYAFNYGGLRFYLSKLNGTELNVNRNGIILLNKQESLQMQGSHEGILNDLRAHGTLLPLEFGTVARSKDELLGKIDARLPDLKLALKELSETARWSVSAFVLDARIAQLVGTPESAARRDVEPKRPSYSPPLQRRGHDIKVLERLLQLEKKIAESIHRELSKVAGRAEVETMINLGSGSSENWKLILKASYEVSPRALKPFYRTVTDLQYQHLLLEIMLSIAGNRGPYSFQKK